MAQAKSLIAILILAAFGLALSAEFEANALHAEDSFAFAAAAEKTFVQAEPSSAAQGTPCGDPCEQGQCHWGGHCAFSLAPTWNCLKAPSPVHLLEGIESESALSVSLPSLRRPPRVC